MPVAMGFFQQAALNSCEIGPEHKIYKETQTYRKADHNYTEDECYFTPVQVADDSECSDIGGRPR